MSGGLVLSIFPGVDGLGRGFERLGYCVVRGPDVLWGGDIREFHPPHGVFWLVVGGPPCQDFTPIAAINRSLGRQPRFGNLIPEFERCISEAMPDCFLMENVERAPLPVVSGFHMQLLRLDNRWFGAEQHRVRHFTFGSRVGRQLVIDGVVALENPDYEYAVTSTTGYLLESGSGYKAKKETAARRVEAARRPISRLAELQGESPDFLKDAPFTMLGKRRAIANMVPRPMADALARAVKAAMEAAR